MSILDRIRAASTEASYKGLPFDKYEVTQDEYAALLKELAFYRGVWESKPLPPIKKIENSVGLFHQSSSIEYDHHAPEYLAALENWEKRQASAIGFNKLVIWCTTGAVDIVVKKS